MTIGIEMLEDKDILVMEDRNPEKKFRALMAKYKESVYWHIRRIVVSHDDALDATQETFIRIFRSLGQLKGEKSLPSWIFRIATNEALRIRGRYRHERVPWDQADEELGKLKADEYVDYGDIEAIRLQKAILSLPTKQQIAFNLRYYNELGYDEIAEITDSTADSVKSNYHIAKEKIIKYMNSI